MVKIVHVSEPLRPWETKGGGVETRREKFYFDVPDFSLGTEK